MLCRALSWWKDVCDPSYHSEPADVPALFRTILQLHAINTLRRNWEPNQTHMSAKTGLDPIYDEFDKRVIDRVYAASRTVVAQQKHIGSHTILE